MRRILAKLLSWLVAGYRSYMTCARQMNRLMNTDKCQGCLERVRLVGSGFARRREAAYCGRCLAKMGIRSS